MAERALERWASSLLKRLNIRENPENLRMLVGWAKAEGGHFHNNAKYNVLNTTQSEPGAGNAGSQGNIKVYRNWDQGLKATVQTLRNGRYGGILHALKSGSVDDFVGAIGSSPWGTSSSLVASTVHATPRIRPGTGGNLGNDTASPSTGPTYKTISGTDNSPARQQLLQTYVSQRGKPGALAELGFGLQGAQDTPSRRVQTSAGTYLNSGPSAAPTAGALPNTSHSLDEMFRIAGDVDKLNNKGKVPYAWGGGHGASPAAVGTPVDCSGFVSQILGVAPRVSGNFASSWGKPGAGKWVTVYANSHHVFISMRDPQTNKMRWFGTSRSNPGGGAGEIDAPSQAYLASFTKRHPGRRSG